MFARLFKARTIGLGFVWGLLAAPLIFGLYVHAAATSNANAEPTYDLQPVINSQSVPPLVMLVMSRDEQLYNKAYTDYTDLHQGEKGDLGVINATYDDTFSYAGYFGSALCYSYSGGVYKADNPANGTNGHSCNGSEWSGNFLNWLTMSRLDIVRQVLYGGLRSTDQVGPDQTVLERAAIPNDLHAWVKVYSGTDVNQYTPFTGTVSFCNATFPGSTTPGMRVAQGNFTEWSATQDSQCNWRDTDNDSNNAPKSSGLGSLEYTVRVDVCDETAASLIDAKGNVKREPFCRQYTDSSTGTVHYKPAGLLQQYGESGKMRFGLMTGSYADPRSGGRLRRNIGKFAGNGSDPTQCVAGDEVKLSDGTFCNQTAGIEGIVNTLNQFKLVAYHGNPSGIHSGWQGGIAGAAYNDNCYAWGGRARNGNGGTWVLDNPGGASGNRHCSAWGNPLSEIYAEAVRYIEGGKNPTATAVFEAGDDTAYLPGIPDHVKWLDPYRDPANGGSPYCASCSILVLSTGLNSFDTDEIPNDNTGIVTSANAIASTNALGDDEGISGKNYLIGRVLGKLTNSGTISPTSLALGASIDTNADACTGKNIDKLSNAIGICPDVPSLEGSYLIAGLAFKAWTTDLRPDLTTTQNKPTTFVNNVQTYTVALAESLPSFNIPVGSSTINFSPLCQSNTNGGAQPGDPNWSSCALGTVEVGAKVAQIAPNYVYGRPVLPDNSAGSFSFVWEDSTFGSDHDLDSTDAITWCVGAACSYRSPQTQAGLRKNIDGSTFTGYDICWRSQHNVAKPDYAAACATSNDQPVVAANQVLIRVETTSTAGSYAMLEGYNITGTTTDGAQRIELAPGSFNSILTGQANPPANWYLPRVLSFTAGGSSVGRLENPLFYAAKYGGFHPAFDPVSGNPNTPQTPGVVWDGINNTTGAPAPDGLPDNFFPVHNPALLGQQLGNALNAIIKKTGSGTAAAVVSNSVNGNGVVYRALYQPQSQDTTATARSVYWTGTLNTLWIDSFGLVREDGIAGGVGHNAVLDDYPIDPIVVFFTDPTDNTAKFKECTPKDSNFNPAKFDPNNLPGSDVNCVIKTLDQLSTIWDAQQQLWASSGPFVTGIAKQRSYTSTSDTGRYIFTWVDKNHDGKVDPGEQTDFVWTGSSGTTGFYGQNNGNGTFSGDFGFLNSNNPAEAQNIVNWIRGEDDIPGLRSRTIDPVSSHLNANWSGGDVTTRLGDIIDSTPLVIGRPAEAFDRLYGDVSYAKFRAHYRDRRQVVYVGANDGMLHAFNGGFYDASLPGLRTKPIVGSATQHPLGGEIWAYVPGNLLPHLRWLTDAAYQAQHVFYVDGNPVATDAKVFNPDPGDCTGVPAGSQCHPGGWGTVMVVPFRLGGGMIQVPTALKDGGSYDPVTCGKATCVQQTSYSAYAVLDVTDPEQPPVVLAELTPASTDGNGQSFTTSVPAFAVMRNPSSGNPDKFFMFLGSGPTAPANDGLKGTAVTSTAPLRLYAYDLGCLTGVVSSGCGTPSNSAPIKSFDFSNGGVVTGAKNSFAGDLIASDFNLNDQAESVYFGSVRDPQNGSSPIEFQGSLWKLALNENTDPTTWKPELMYDTARPIVARPTLSLNARGAPQVFVGTGRLLAKDDLTTTGQQQILGIIDPELLPVGDVQSAFALPLKPGDLENVTNVQVCGDINNKLCTYGAVTGDPSGATTFAQLQMLFNEAPAIGGKAGFYLNLTVPPGPKVIVKSDGTQDSMAVGGAERVVSAQSLLGGVLISNTFIPGVGICNNVGNAVEYALNYQSGTGDPGFVSATGTSGFGKDAGGNVITASNLGAGLPASPSLHVGTGTGNREVTACTQTSTGAIICEKINALKGVLSGEVSWREPLDQ